MPPNACDQAPSKPPRFSWPLRLFIGFIVFDIVFHSLASLTQYSDWMEEKELRRYPRRMPTLQEIQSPDPDDPPGERAWRSLDSTWEYFKPWPDKKTRDSLDGWYDHTMYGVGWVSTRLALVETQMGYQQRWTMFSPNVRDGTYVARFRLAYADGTYKIARVAADPEDLTRFSRWFGGEKILDAEAGVYRYEDSITGYCNYLTHQHRSNKAGAKLVKIYTYRVEYHYPKPDEDAAEVFLAQNGPPGWDDDGPRWSYDVAAKELHELSTADKARARALIAQGVSR